MIEENTISMAAARSPGLGELGLSREEQQRLERVGVRNATELNALRQNAGIQTVARLGDLPVDRLRSVLSSVQPNMGGARPQPSPKVPPKPVPQPPVFTPPRPSAPVVTPRAPIATPIRNVLVPRGTKLLGIDGSNLMALGSEPEVRWNGRRLPVTDLDDDRLVVRNDDGFESGALQVVLPGGETVTYEIEVEGSDELGFEEYDPAGAWRS
jgi:hypothetical protein